MFQSPDHDVGRDRHRELKPWRRSALHGAVWLLASTSGVTGLAAQDVAPGRAAARARIEQREFERVRRRNYHRDAWHDGRCHEHVGRFCLNHDGDDEWVVPPEAAVVASRRVRLLAVLDSAYAASPSDPWVTGQRIRYLLEAGEREAAFRAVEACESAGWWCPALEGFVLHEAGMWADAGLAFEEALGLMSEAERCAWEDVHELLEGDDRGEYRDLPCGSSGRRRFEDRFWHLSDPLWSTAGEERRTEHHARRVWSALSEDAASGYGLRWGADLAELTIRYGWPAGWDLAWRRSPGAGTEQSVEAHRAADAQRFAVTDLAIAAPRWNLDDDRPRSTWESPVGPIGSLPAYQIAGFLRGDRRLVIAALPEGRDDGCEATATLALSSGSEVVARSAPASNGTLRVLEPVPGSVQFIGLETRCETGAGAARSRFPVTQPRKWLSDLLLLDPGEDLPGTLDATLERVRPHGVVRAGERIVVFWEWYGPVEMMTVTLSLSRQNKSFWRKALEWSGLADRGIESTGVRWSEIGPGGEWPRAMWLDLPDLTEGEYRMTLHVQSARVGSVSSTREIVVER